MFAPVLAEEERDIHVDGLHPAGGDLRDGQRGVGREEPGTEIMRS